MARAYYQCSNCFEITIDDRTPGREHGGCPHNWKKIANEGNKYLYVCKKCGKSLGVSSTPQSTPCPHGGSHSWSKRS